MVIATIGGAVLAFPLDAFAQTTTVPDAARIERVAPMIGDMNRDLSPGYDVLVDSGDDVFPLAPRPAGAAQIPLTLTGIELVGVSAYTPDMLSPLWVSRLNQAGTLADLYDIADAITRRYRDDGYVLARAFIPEQEIGASARIQVFEGQIGSVTLVGDLERGALVDDILAQIGAQRLFNTHQLEAAVLRLRDLPGSDFKMVVKPGAGNQVDVTVVGEKKADIDFSLAVHNGGSRYLGPWMASVPVRAEGVLSDYDAVYAQFDSTLPTKELRNVLVGYQMPILIPGLIGSVQAGSTRGAPGYTLSDLDIHSALKTFDARLDYTAYRQRDQSLVLSTGVLVQQARTDLAGARIARDDVRSVFLGAEYNWQDYLYGISSMRGQISHGLPGLLGGSKTGDADLSRAAGQADFIKAELVVHREQLLPDDFSLVLQGAGQISSGPLLSTQEFGFGGGLYGRGYDPSQYSGDSGLAVLMELRSPHYDLGQAVFAQPFIFADYGRVWNRDSGQSARESGASVGGGARFTLPINMTTEVMFARPLLNRDDPTTNRTRGNRALFSFTKSF